MTEFERDLVAEMPYLHKFARSLSNSMAEDLVQDTMERALRKRDQFQPGTSMRRWLNSILYSRFINELRASPGRRAASNQNDHVPIDPEFIPQPERQENIRFCREICARLTTVPTKYRESLVLVVRDGMGSIEISKLLGIPVGTVRSRTNRAREILRALR